MGDPSRRLACEEDEKERFLAAVRDGLADSEAGRVISDEELGRDLDEALGALDE
jgi:predicted transcriptional regulator